MAKKNDTTTAGTTTAGTTETTDTTETKGLGQRDANKEAAKIAFHVLYNKGEEWPADLYEDKSDDDKIAMHQGYTNLLAKVAKLGGIGVKKATVTFDV